MISKSLRAPAEVKGKFQSIRNVLHPFLILLFLLLPWLQFGGHDFFILNVFDRNFIIFGYQFFSHDAPLLFFVAVILILLIFLVTAVWGRLWCGWLCPQSVFLHSVFNKIEKAVLGVYTQRVRLFSSEAGLFRNIILYFLFALSSWLIAHSVLAYFVGGQKVIQYILDGPWAHPLTFGLLLFVTGVLFANFTFFREKLCLYICPYGRFQNALIDRNSLTVYFDTVRGEPRGPRSLQGAVERGDCVDCGFCVRACPAKIDIRKGFQLECISCAMCIDACDSIMKKLGRMIGLIRFETGDQRPMKYTRFRLLLYGLLILVFTSGFIWLLNKRQPVSLEISRAVNPSFFIRDDKASSARYMVNRLNLHLLNLTQEELQLRIVLSDSNRAQGMRLLGPTENIRLTAGHNIILPVFVDWSEENFNEKLSQVELSLRPQREDLSAEDVQVSQKIKFIRVTQ